MSKTITDLAKLFRVFLRKIVREEIMEHESRFHTAPKKSEHYDGEPCIASFVDVSKQQDNEALAAGLNFFHTGIHRAGKPFEWVLVTDCGGGKSIQALGWDGKIHSVITQCWGWILRAIPIVESVTVPVEPPKSEHYDGEPCNLSMTRLARAKWPPEKFRMEYTGKKWGGTWGVPVRKAGEIHNAQIVAGMDNFYCGCWELRAIPIVESVTKPPEMTPENNCPSLAQRQTNEVKPWCDCETQKQTKDEDSECLGCRIDRLVREELGEIGYAHLKTNTCREMRGPK